MSHVRLLLFAIASWACSLASGELHAQAPTSRIQSKPFVQAQRGRQAVNSNARGITSTAAPSPVTELNPRNPAEVGLTYIAVIGAVNQPAVFETTERSLPLGVLIERAGGMSADSNGTVSLLDLGRAHSIDSVARNLNQQIGNGQIVYLVPRGGSSPTQLLSSRPVLSSKKILITGLTNGPRLFRVDDQKHSLGDLIVTLRQSVELLERGDVIATQPQGVPMNLGSELVANSVIHFNPAAVSYDGLREAVLQGFRLEQAVRLEGQPASPSAQPAATRPASPTPAPVNTKPQIIPRPDSTRDGPLPPDTSSLIPETLTPATDSSGIEAAGSSTVSPEPLLFPKEIDSGKESLPSGPHSKADSRPPLMMPKTWQQPGDTSSDGSDGKSERVIERTSAGHNKHGHNVVTASASASTSAEDLKPRRTKPALDLSEIEKEALGDEESVTTSLLPGPQSWLILFLVAGVVGASIFVSRLISRPDFAARAARQRSEGFGNQPSPMSQPKAVQLSKATQAPAIAPQPVAARAPLTAAVSTPTPAEQKRDPVRDLAPVQKAVSAEEDQIEQDQRFLQRLIMNQVTVVEEEPFSPLVDHLHGTAVGASRMIVHEAHENVSGPHFHVRPKGDAREIELRLRRLLRTDRSKRREEVVHTGEGREIRETQTGPLERALRTVDRGGTQ